MSKKVQEHVLKQYILVRQMGSGAYGHVWEVQEKKTKKKFALKKVFDAFRDSVDAQRTYRQVEILKQLKSQNVVKLFRVMKSKNRKDLYLIFQFMEADLHSIVGSTILQKMHQIYIFYQILKGLKYMHCSELIHRDLKPSNVLLNSQCQAKLCDFGLVRSLNTQDNEQAILSEQVATKWYRAPELLLGSRSYSKPIDVWSFGCIVAEILTSKPMFAGDSTLNQLQKIVEYTGEVSQEDILSLDSPVAEQLISQIKVKKRSFREYFSSVDPDFWVMLKGTLEFNPNKRMSIDQVLALELFDEFRQQIKSLNEKFQGINAIKPRIDDNVRLNLKVYRQKIYEDIDKKHQRSQSTKQKRLVQVQQNLGPVTRGIRRVVSVNNNPVRRRTQQKYKQKQSKGSLNHNHQSKIAHPYQQHHKSDYTQHHQPQLQNKRSSMMKQNNHRPKPANSSYHRKNQEKRSSFGKLVTNNRNSNSKTTIHSSHHQQSKYQYHSQNLKFHNSTSQKTLVMLSSSPKYLSPKRRNSFGRNSSKLINNSSNHYANQLCQKQKYSSSIKVQSPKSILSSSNGSLGKPLSYYQGKNYEKERFQKKKYTKEFNNKGVRKKNIVNTTGTTSGKALFSKKNILKDIGF